MQNVENLRPRELWVELLAMASNAESMHLSGNMVKLDHTSVEMVHLIRILDDYICFNGEEIEYTTLGKTKVGEEEVHVEVDESALMESSVVTSSPTLPPLYMEPYIPDDLVELLFTLSEFVETLDDSGFFNSVTVDQLAHEYRQAFRTKLTEERDAYSNRNVRRPEQAEKDD